MSSYLSKSKKEFKPNIPARRGATSSNHGLARASAERQSVQPRTTPAYEELASPAPVSGKKPFVGSSSDIQSPQAYRDAPVSRSRGPASQEEDAYLRTGRWPLGIEDGSRSYMSSESLAAGQEHSDRVQNLNAREPSQQSIDSPSNAPTFSDNQGLASKECIGNGPVSSKQGDSQMYHESATMNAYGQQDHNGDVDAGRAAKRLRMEHSASEVLGSGMRESNQVDQSRERQHRSGRRKRTKTPDGAERAVISPTVMTMSELTKDIRVGKSSVREQRLQEKDKIAAAQRRSTTQAQARDEAQEFMTLNRKGATDETRVSMQDNITGSASSGLPVEPPPQPTRLAPQTRVVNGQIVQDEDSRIVDRSLVATTAAGMRPADAIEEDELSRQVNSGNYMKRERHTKWNTEETERFYTGLRWFGTDFQLIAHMFPGRTRRQIKLKFNKEERDPLKSGDVKRALHNERCMADLNKFEEYSRTTLMTTEALEKDIANDRDQITEAQRRESEAIQKARKEREEHAEREAETARQKEAIVTPSVKHNSKKTATPTYGKTGSSEGELLKRTADAIVVDRINHEQEEHITANQQQEISAPDSSVGAGESRGKNGASKGKGNVNHNPDTGSTLGNANMKNMADAVLPASRSKQSWKRKQSARASRFDDVEAAATAKTLALPVPTQFSKGGIEIESGVRHKVQEPARGTSQLESNIGRRGRRATGNRRSETGQGDSAKDTPTLPSAMGERIRSASPVEDSIVVAPLGDTASAPRTGYARTRKGIAKAFKTNAKTCLQAPAIGLPGNEQNVRKGKSRNSAPSKTSEKAGRPVLKQCGPSAKGSAEGGTHDTRRRTRSKRLDPAFASTHEETQAAAETLLRAAG